MKNKILISIFVVGLVLLVCTLYITLPLFTESKEVSLGDFSVSQQSYNSIMDKFGDEKVVSVCNVEKGDCVWLYNIENIKNK